MNLYYMTPFSPTKNLAKAYNDYMKIVPDGSWVCFTDYDVCFLDPSFDAKIRSHILRKPDAGIFTCLTNRVGAKYQCYQGQISPHSDMKLWRRVAEQLATKNDGQSIEIKREISGFCMVFSKETWSLVDGFSEVRQGALGVDNDFSLDVLRWRKIYRMDDVFAYHYYRTNEGIGYKEHLK